ncbi:fungal specific transcription factor domain-containing protein [Aspergillus puulaauensis]|uniref:Fungal-specific transcription factor domain-containing protein n=1 Tax=Aspergillus puulaauensis TaxID=1220207 RepID=A0A7R7XI39_9EURO|nr:uncharacterized protein APUU_30096A [Aspergillus puulaauensis]BCS21871.1 hypothetical protein APUU_30096A [Aspergillus puulaauensis]
MVRGAPVGAPQGTHKAKRSKTNPAPVSSTAPQTAQDMALPPRRCVQVSEKEQSVPNRDILTENPTWDFLNIAGDGGVQGGISPGAPSLLCNFPVPSPSSERDNFQPPWQNLQTGLENDLDNHLDVGMLDSLSWLENPKSPVQAPSTGGAIPAVTHDNMLSAPKSPTTTGNPSGVGANYDTQNYDNLIATEIDRALNATRPSDSDAFEQYLLKHFIDILAPSFYPFDSKRNPYTAVYVPLAGRSSALRNAILVASANHLVSLGQFPPWAMEPYRSALKNSLRKSSNCADANYMMAATVLLSIAAEVIGSGIGTWSVKLEDARKLLFDSNHGSLGAKGKFLRLHYTWMAVIGRTLWAPGLPVMPLTDPPLLNDNHESEVELSTEQEQWFGNLPDYSMLVLMRTATEFAQKVGQIPIQADPIQTMQQMLPEITDLIISVRMWQPKASSAMEPYAKSVLDVGEIWRQGLLCYIYTDICSLSPSNSRLSQCVAAAIPAIQRLTWMQCVLWPVFMIGLNANNQENQSTIESSLQKMNFAHHFKTPLSLINILRKVWSSQGSSSKWWDIMSECGLELNILL